MSKLILVTGGARSGKSTYAEKLVSELSQHVTYIATGIITDEDMAARIEHHKKRRPSHWKTIESYKDFEKLTTDEAFVNSDVFLLDCLTVMMTNLMFDEPVDYDTCSMDEVNLIEIKIQSEIEKLLGVMAEHNKTLVLVSNEVGLGLVPAYRLGNLFRDIAGRMNQYVASRADSVLFIVSGLPLKLK